MIQTDITIKGNAQMHQVKPQSQHQEVNQKIRVEQQTGVNKHGQTKVDRGQLADAVDSLNKTMKIFDRGLEFTIHEDTNRIIVRVVDRSDHNNEEVIREIPPERILDMIAAFMDMIGLLVDQRA